MTVPFFFAGLFLLNPSAAAEDVHAHHGHAHEEAPANEEVVLLEQAPENTEPGVLVIAPDRGFLGNEEIRDAVGEFSTATGADVALVLVTGEQTSGRLEAAMESLRSGTDRTTLVQRCKGSDLLKPTNRYISER